MKRTAVPELLDTDSGTPAEIAASLSDLRGINRRFGGFSTTGALIEQVATTLGVAALSVLEVAAGASELPGIVRTELKKKHIEIDVTLLDRVQSHFGERRNGSRAIVGNAVALPFADASFDVVCSCLFVHHLEPQEVIQSVNEALRVCRSAVLINDLIRSPLHLALVYAGLPLFHSRLTRHDAPASVRQAYTADEMLELLKATNARKTELRRRYLYRMGVVIWK